MAARKTTRAAKATKRTAKTVKQSPRKAAKKTASSVGKTARKTAKKSAKKSARKPAKKSARKPAKPATKKAAKKPARKVKRAAPPAPARAKVRNPDGALTRAARKVEGLSAEQRVRIERAYEKAIHRVDESDVKYALVKTGDNVRKVSESSLSWMRLMGRQFELLYHMLQDWWSDRAVLPWRTVSAVTAALLYFVSPIDLIPDFIPVIGYLDDLLVLGLCVRLVRDDLREYAARKGISLEEYGLEGPALTAK
jgi:uncharacterized membrane protein YkvA (DUF1232 family)